MAEGQDDGVGDGDKAAADGAKSHDNLPMVVAPKLGAGDEHVDDAPTENTDASATVADSAPSSRFLILAASVAFAAAFGSFVGSVSGSGAAHVLFAPAPTTAATTAANEVAGEMKRQLAELSAIKAGLETAARSNTGQFTKLSDRLDRLDQRASKASEITGSITAVPSPPSPPAPKLTDRILPDWVVQDVQGGRALVESRYGGVFDVGAGSVLPGVGRVDQIKRQDGQWLVLTERGTIVSGR